MKGHRALLAVAVGFLACLFAYNLAYAGQTTTTLRPNSTVTGQWTGAGTADASCTGNCQRVDEITANDNTDYVNGQAAAIDEYGLQDINANAQIASNVKLRVRWTRWSTESCVFGTPTQQPLTYGLRIGGNLTTTTQAFSGSNQTYMWSEFNLSAGYTQAEINGMTAYIQKTVAPSCGLGITQAVFRVTMVEVEVTWQTPEFDQSATRVYQNQNNIQPGSPLAVTNAMADVPQSNQFRVRMGVLNSHTNWLTGTWGDHSNQYKLQYVERSAASCSAQASGWADVTGATAIRYYNNATPADGDTISANANDPDTGGSTKIYQYYEESNPISLRAQVNTGQTAIWDFSLVDAGSTFGTVYCLRIVKSDGTTINSYTSYASVVITGNLDIDIVDSGGSSVVSPNMPFSSVLVLDACQQPTGTLGLASQIIRVTNNLAANGWSVSLAATNGPTANWSNGATGTYDFNDNGGSPNGCTDGGDTDALAGQLTVSPNTGTLTPQSGCSSTGTALGSQAKFLEGSVDSITLATASSSTPRFCYFSITGVGLAQQIPSWRPKGDYTLDFTLTVMAS